FKWNLILLSFFHFCFFAKSLTSFFHHFFLFGIIFFDLLRSQYTFNLFIKLFSVFFSFCKDFFHFGFVHFLVNFFFVQPSIQLMCFHSFFFLCVNLFDFDLLFGG